MANYLKNSILKYNRIDMGDYSVPDYGSLNMVAIQQYVNSCDYKWFDWYRMDNNDNLERIALELYGNPDYWDILMVINNKNPFDVPLDLDAICSTIEYKIAEFESKLTKETDTVNTFNTKYGVVSTKLQPKTYLTFYDELEKIESAKSEKNRTMLIVKPTYITDFIKGGYDKGVFVNVN